MGIIAAITVPSLIAKYHEDQLKAQLKKSYSTLSNALNSAISDFGYIPNCWYYYKSGVSKTKNNECDILIPAFLTKMSVIKYCENKAMDNGCLPIYKEYSTDTSGCTSMFSRTQLNGNAPAWVLGNGMIFFSPYPINSNNYVFYFDMNGFQGPNTPGKDVFAILFAPTNQQFNNLKITGNGCAPGRTLTEALKEAYK